MPDEPTQTNPEPTQPTPPTPTTIDEAGQAAQAMLEQTPQPDPTQTQDPAPQQPPQPPQLNPDDIMRQAFGEIQALKQQNEQLRKAVEQQSEIQKQTTIEEALQMPTIDFAALSTQNEETQKATQAKYTQDMMNFIQQTTLKELSPIIEQAKEGLAQKQKGEIINALSKLPELQGITQMLPQLDNIISKNKALASSNAPLDEKYITAYLIAQGLKAQQQQTQMTPEKFTELYNTNPAFKDIIEKQRLANVQGAQNVPPFSPSSGAVNAALTMPNKPTNFDEANELTKKLFGA